MIRISPTQNGGRLMPSSATLISARSRKPLARSAATTPKAMPTLNEMSIAAHRQDQRAAEPLDHFAEHRSMQLDRLAEVTAHDVAQPGHVLHVDRLIQAICRAQCRDLLLGRARAEQHARGITGRQARDDEHEQGHAQQHHHDEEEPLDEVPLHDLRRR